MLNKNKADIVIAVIIYLDSTFLKTNFLLRPSCAVVMNKQRLRMVTSDCKGQFSISVALTSRKI